MPNQRREFLQQAIVGVPGGARHRERFRGWTPGEWPGGFHAAVRSRSLSREAACGSRGSVARAVSPQCSRREEKRGDGFRMLSVYYDAEPNDPIPTILLIPDGATKAKPAPAVAVWHQHNGRFDLGKSEPSGLAGNPMHHTGVALAREGYVVVCPDALCFGERQDPTGKLKRGDYERFQFLRYVVAGKCLAWKNILDMKRAIDFLCSRPEVRADRIGCYGHSMGSTHTWLVGPWEPRLMSGRQLLSSDIRRHSPHHIFSTAFPISFPGFINTETPRHRLAHRAASIALQLRRDRSRQPDSGSATWRRANFQSLRGEGRGKEIHLFHRTANGTRALTGDVAPDQRVVCAAPHGVKAPQSGEFPGIQALRTPHPLTEILAVAGPVDQN